MLCQSCGKKTAAFHFTRNINGEVTEKHLCPDCAKKAGYEGLFPHLQTEDYLNSMLPGFFINAPAASSRACPLCGAAQADIGRTGKVGCAKCYETFADILTPFIRRIHGTAEHTGKLPESAGEQLKAKRELTRLREELKKAVDAQEYEQAAVLRDRIRELDGNE